MCVCILSYYDIDLYVLRAGVSVNAGSGGEEMEEICLAPLGRDCRPCWAYLSLGTTAGFCATCWGKTFESGVLSTSERRMLCGERFGWSPCESAC